MPAHKTPPPVSAMAAACRCFDLNMTWVEGGYNGACALLLGEGQARCEARVDRTFLKAGKTLTVLSCPNALVENAK